MNKNWLYLLALLLLPCLRLLVDELHYDDSLHAAHYDRAAAFIALLRGNAMFQSFIGGYVFPIFVVLTVTYWALEEDKSRIPTQFLLLPLFYIPFSIVGFTLVSADFQVSYLYVNTLVVLTFGYIYVILWVAVIALFEKFNLVQ